MPHGYDEDNISALDAITDARRIAFQATVNLRDYGILSFMDKCGQTGALRNDIISAVNLNRDAVEFLLEAGLRGRLIDLKNDHYFLSKTGHDLIHDRMTRMNMDFTQNVCCPGMFYLDEALS